MKILFFSQDENVHSLVKGVNHQNLVVSDDMDELLDQSGTERSLVFLDFDDDKKTAEKLNKKLMDTDDVRIIMTETIKLKELKKHQKGKTAADGYVRKPLSLEIINQVLNDFELADFIEESEAFNEGDRLGDAPQSFIPGVNGSVYDNEDGDESTGVDFGADMMQVDERVKKQIDAHSLQGDDTPNFATPICVDIQEKFDMLFERPSIARPVEALAEEEASVHIPGPDEQTAPDAIKEDKSFTLDLGDDDEDDASVDLDLSEDEEENVDLDLSEDHEESEDLDLSMDEETAPPQEEKMNEDDDLDIDIEEDTDLDEGALEFGGAAVEVEDDVQDEEVEGLDFGGLEDSEEGASEPVKMEEVELTDDEGGFDLGADDSEELDLGDDSEALDLGADNSGELDLGADDAGELDLGADDSGELDLGGDDSGELDLGADDSGELDLGGDDSGELDLGAEEGSGSLDLGSPDSEDGLDLSAEEEEDIFEDDGDDVSATLQGIVSKSDDDGMDLAADLDEEADLGISEEVNLDEDLGTADDLDFSLDEEAPADDSEGTMTEANQLDGESLDLSAVEEDEELEGFEEDTNPTIIMGSDDDELKEFKTPLPESEVSSLEEEIDDSDVLDLSGIDEDTSEFDPDSTLTDMHEEEDLDHTEIEEDFDEDVTVIEPAPQALAPEPEVTPEPVPEPVAVVEAAPAQILITPEEQKIPEAFNQTEQTRLQATIRQLREEREELLKEIHELKTDSKLGDQERLGLQAELDESKIEIQILKKRNRDESDELRYQLRLSDEKKQIYEERSKSVQKEFDRLNQKVRIDINQVKQREKELESQLELVTMDSQSQVKTRDMKILDLKRKIDSLEFNMENTSIKEVKSREDKERVEERLEKIMRTLRGSLKSLESDTDIDDGILDKIDKL